MKTIILISCVSKKLPVRAKAGDIYISPLFRLNLKYAKKLKPDAIYILSAEHHLLGLDTVIDPYDKTLNTMLVGERREWAEYVLKQLSACSDLESDRFTFLAGAKYREFIAPHLKHREVPMKTLRIGKQLQFLKAKLDG